MSKSVCTTEADAPDTDGRWFGTEVILLERVSDKSINFNVFW